MENIKEQIFAYPQLSTEEQRAVEAYVEANPEWASLLRDIRKIESSIQEFPDAGPVLTTYVVAQCVGMEEPSPMLRDAFARLERALEQDDELRDRAEEIRSRLERAEKEIDPVSHFESLTGHSLTGSGGSDTSSEATGSQNDRSVQQQGAGSFVWQLVDEFRALPLVVRGIGATLGVLLVGYFVLFTVDTATQSPLDRLAAVEVSDQMVESYYSTETRGAAPAADTLTTDELYLRSLSTLREAESSTFGLFQRYNPDSLRRAEKGLRRVLERTDPNSFLALEARFYLGKTYLARERVDEACTHLETVVEEDGRRADEARRILDALDEVELDTSAATPS